MLYELNLRGIKKVGNERIEVLLKREEDLDYLKKKKKKLKKLMKLKVVFLQNLRQKYLKQKI